MKTPKEKAVELIDKFTYWNTSEAEREGIKSALHCVDEILEHTYYFFEELEKDGLLHQFGDEIQYWEEVKEEINKINGINNL